MSTLYHAGTRLSIKPTYIVSTPYYEGGTAVRSHEQRQAEVNLSDNRTEGQLSKKAVTRLRNSVNWLIQSAKWKRVKSKKDGKMFFFKVNFTTLTIPKQNSIQVTDKMIAQLLHRWLVYARKYMYLKNYVWKLEAHKDGRIHIHITADTFLHWKRVRQSWNRILKSEGILDEYIAKSGNDNPNSTDIHSVKNLNNLAGYICAYMTKKTDLHKDFTGKIWGCNYDLSDANKCTVIIENDINTGKYLQPLMDKRIKWKKIEQKDKFGIVRTVGEIYFIKQQHWEQMSNGKIKDAYNYHRSFIRGHGIKPPPEYFEIDYFSERNRAEYNKKESVAVPQQTIIINEEQRIISAQLELRNTTKDISTRQIQMFEMQS